MWIKEFEGKRGWVILVHGLGEHSKRYGWLVELLKTVDYGLTLFDLPGHGESPGKRGHLSFKKVFRFIDSLLERHPNSFLFGHSLGGLIAIRYAETRFCKSLRGLIVTSPALHLPNVSPSLRLLAAVTSVITPWVTFDNRIDPNLLSTNKEAVKRYVEDPLVHRRISAKLAHDMFTNSKKAIEEAEKITIPCFVAVGTEDKIVLPTGAEQFSQKVASKDKIFKAYEGCFHELFEDTTMSSLFKQDLINWLINH
ncbi:alpha/beta hydrolase [Pseudothermotoga thermarum]|uniref:Alpha/beta hydrolase fold protein n=1 Tax=Pseudothermotoga thermarum DSM 5069 TaxID=688269 RepID=F7YYI5_9THEM|nr:alpha/beta hydrolase [Pseudothermotoga thermarum]AEH51014.1 alpha/beta hydrolase fold protein [Pseudothermotoga thermarum DSM 5069]